MDEPGKIGGEWASEALRSEQDAGLDGPRFEHDSPRVSDPDTVARSEALSVKPVVTEKTQVIDREWDGQIADEDWEAAKHAHPLPVESAARKEIPIVSGVLDYFPAALAEVAKVSKAGNDKHNPGEPLHWARMKSMDQADAIGRHLIERGGIDPDTGMRYSAQLAWRALALLQLELEAEGAPLARGASEAS